MKLCLIYNYAQHYRADIFFMLDRYLGCDFYFGNKMDDVKKMDYSILHNFQKEVKNVILYSPLYYQKGIIKLLYKPYTHYIMLGEPFCLSTWLMLFMAKIYGKKIFLWTHGWYGRETILKKYIKKKFFNLSAGLFLYGEYAKIQMTNEGFNNRKLFVVYNSLSYDRQLEIRKKQKATNIYKEYFKNTNPNLIFVGRLTKVKKLGMLLQAVANLCNRNIFFNLVLVGNGEEMEELKKKATLLNISNVWFYGASYNENLLAELIYNADLCVSPGNVGLTAIHSLSYGTPVITHNNFKMQMPEFEAIESGKTGLFFEYNNQEALEKTIIEWVKTHQNRELTRKKCYEVIDQKYNPHVQIQTIERVLYL